MRKRETLKEPPRESSQRHAIQQAALELFARRGYHGAGMQAIAQAVGLTKATLYWHFASKEELFRYVYQDFVQEMLRPLGQALDGSTLPQDKLLDIAEKSLALAREHVDSLRIFIQLTAQPELAETVALLVAEEMAQWVEVLAPLFDALGDPDPSATARLFAARRWTGFWFTLRQIPTWSGYRISFPPLLDVFCHHGQRGDSDRDN